jgi:hypothetical protein
MKSYLVFFRDNTPDREVFAESADHAMTMIADDEKPWVHSIVPNTNAN